MTGPTVNLLQQPRVFPPLPLSTSPDNQRPPRVCIVSPEFIGLTRNGGIGTAYTALARALAAAGQQVTCLFLGGNVVASRDIQHWIEEFKRDGIELVPLPQIKSPALDAPVHAAKSYEVYAWLKQNDRFDVVHFPEWQGPGYYTLSARHQGLAFANTTFCVGAHSATAWLKIANREFINCPAEIEMDFMERQSVALADVVFSPSQYLLNWMVEQNWQLPPLACVQQYVQPQSARFEKKTGWDDQQNIGELVFFGRLETRKGVVLFCDALDKISPDIAKKIQTITFLGKEATVEGVPAQSYIAKRAVNWPWQPKFLSTLDQPQAIEFLRQPGRLAVIPSLIENSPNTVYECLGAGIAFIANRSGGIPELIAAEDVDRVCFDAKPAALTAQIATALNEGFRPARASVAPETTEQAWIQWHANQVKAPETAVATTPVAHPKVSLCLVTINRPKLLRQALMSIQSLDYPNFEVVLVDDGSTQPEALAALEEIKPLFDQRGWKIVRQENRYLGAARNTAVRHASGEFFLFMDDDNFAEPHELSTFVRVAQKTGADIVTCGLNYFPGQDAPDVSRPPQSRWLPLGGAAAAGAFRNVFGDANSLVRRSCFEQIGGFTEVYGVGHEDWEFYAKSVLRGFKLVVVPEFLFWYRVNPDSMVRTSSRYANHLRTLQPYLDSVPPELHQLVMLAQGAWMDRAKLAANPAYSLDALQWRSQLEAARTLVKLGHKKPAIDQLLTALKSAEKTDNPLLILDALLEVGREFRPLDPGRAKEVLKLAVQLGETLKHPQSVLAAKSILDDLQASPASVQKKSTPQPAASSAQNTSRGNVIVSIVIPTFNRLDLTHACLKALRANTPLAGCELIFVDNNSTDGTREFLANEQRAGRLKAILNAENHGFARACNQGATAAQGRYILFLNNDTEVKPNWLEPLTHTAEADPRIGALGSKLLFPDTTIQHAGIAIIDDRLHRDPLLAQHVFHHQPHDVAEANKPKTYQALTAACLLVRNEIFREVGGFDEEFWNGYEDVDLCFKIRQSGRLVVYQPASVVVHHESQSGGERFRKAKQNIARLHAKWLKQVKPDFILGADGEVTRTEANCIADYHCPDASPGDQACVASIIVLVFNQLEHTRACLESISASTKLPHEIIVVDNGSTDGTPEFLKNWHAAQPNRFVIRNETNLGFAAGNNQALSIARGENVVLLNNDTVVTHHWLENMLHVFTQHPDTGVTGPMSNRVSGPQFVRDVSYRNLSELPAFAVEWARAHRGQSFETCRAVGFCLMARRAVIERLGGLEEKFGPGNFEDDDFCIRAQIAGYKIRIAKDAFVHHTGSQTFNGERIDYHKSMLANWDIFKAKWQFPANTSLEQGYPVPKKLPEGVALTLRLPSLALSHKKSGDRFWAQEIAQPVAAAATSTTAPVARLGNLDEARALFGRRDLPGAWNAAISALHVRPFHPEAFLLLAEIALLAGDARRARECAQHARTLAPNWNAAKQFLKKPLKGDTRLDWLLPASLLEAAKSPRLSVCVITRNEEKFLGRCLASIRSLAQQMIVVDTGSTDRTIEIARENGADVHSCEWADDFSAARNAALEHATGDWILMLDADEELPVAQHARLVEDSKDAGTIAVRLPLINHGQEADGQSYVPRFFRNAPGVYFSGRIHEQVFPSLVTLGKTWGLKTALGTAQITHHGYSTEMVKDRNKVERNLRLLHLALAENPADANLVMNLGLELVRSDDLPGGLAKYREAFRLMSAQKPSDIVPELREVLLTQFSSQLYKIREHAEVVRVLGSPLAKNGGLTASLHFALGLSHFELKNYHGAAEQMRQCLAKRKNPALSPVNTDIHTAAPQHCLALSLARSGDFAAAEKAFEAALQEPGRLEDVKLDYAKFLVAQNRQVDALHKLHEVVSENAGQIAAWRLGGEIALSQPEFLEFARDWSGEAMRFVAGDIAIVAQRAEALMLGGETASARELWARICSTENQPRALAALILCEALESEITHAPAGPGEEAATSREFILWYQKLVELRAGTVFTKLNERTDKIAGALPAAAGMIEKALFEAEQGQVFAN